MEPRLSLVTLAVADVARGRAFYERLGWRASGASTAEVAFFQLNGLALALWGRDALAADAEMTPADPPFRGVALAQNTRSPDEVDRLFAAMVAAGGHARKSPEATPWGGYAGYVADPDGHLWELAHNPGFPLDAAGNLSLPP
jgi:uncharacterized protein